MEKNIFHKHNHLLIQAFYLFFLVFIGFIIFSFLGGTITQLVYKEAGLTQLMEHPDAVRLFQTICSFGFFLFPALSFSFLLKGNLFSYSSIGKNVPLRMVATVILLALLIIPIISWLTHLNQMLKLPDSLHQIEEWMQRNEAKADALIRLLTEELTFSNLSINIIALAFIPALCEEFMFRGTIQPFLNKVVKNIHVAIVLSALLFSAIHFQFYGFFPRFLLGIYLGYLLYWSGSLWLPIAAHFLHNAFTLLMDFYTRKNGIDIDNISPSEIPHFYGLLIISIVFTGIGIWFLRKIKLPSNHEISN